MTFKKQLALKAIVAAFWLLVIWIVTLPPWGDNRPEWVKKYDRRAQPDSSGESQTGSESAIRGRG